MEGESFGDLSKADIKGIIAVKELFLMQNEAFTDNIEFKDYLKIQAKRKGIKNFLTHECHDLYG